jgi:hypothetical protein
VRKDADGVTGAAAGHGGGEHSWIEIVEDAAARKEKCANGAIRGTSTKDEEGVQDDGSSAAVIGRNCNHESRRLARLLEEDEDSLQRERYATDSWRERAAKTRYGAAWTDSGRTVDGTGQRVATRCNLCDVWLSTVKRAPRRVQVLEDRLDMASTEQQPWAIDLEAAFEIC